MHVPRPGAVSIERSPPMASTRTPAKHFSPLAIGAPEPYRTLPVKLERMIHFVPSHNDKIRAKIKSIAAQVDVVLGVPALRVDERVVDRVVAQEVPLRQRWPFVGRVLLRADEHDGAVIPLFPQLGGGGRAGQPGSHDDDRHAPDATPHTHPAVHAAATDCGSPTRGPPEGPLSGG